MGILLALAAVLLASPIVGRRWAWLAGVVVLATPGINNQMTAPLNDVALATLTTLALVAWWQPVVNDENRRWFILAGMAAGGALAIKFVALLLFAVVALVWLWIILRQPARRAMLLQGAAVVSVVAASTSGVWYVRAAWYRGSPVYPFLSQTFDRLRGIPPPSPSRSPEAPLADKTPLGRGPMHLIASPWQVTMHPDRFGGRGHQLGALFLAAVPGIFWTRRLRGLGIVVALAGGYWALWYVLRQNVRFLFPAVPLLSVIVVWVWIELRRLPAWPQRVAVAAFAALLAVSAAAALLRAKDRLPVALGLQTRTDYLARHEPTYPAAEVANQVLPANARILSQEYRGFYFERPIVRENVYRRFTRYDEQITRPGEFSLCLRRAGFTHVLLAETVGPSGAAFDPTLSRLADAQAAADPGALLPLADYRFCDGDGSPRHYRLLMLR
jgi:4-amino-4-deoxy-L-arabinose transferase-like glycosyltransferase